MRCFLHSHSLMASNLASNRLSYAIGSLRWIGVRYFAADKKIMINQDIPVDRMRLIYLDPKTSKKEHKIVTKKEALALGKKMELDLVVVNLEANPPVCKLESYGHILLEERQKERAQRAMQRAQVTKEVQVTIGIDRHDFDTKIKRIKEFLSEGHPVRLSVVPRKRRPLTKQQWLQKQKTGLMPDLSVAASAVGDLDELTLTLLEALEGGAAAGTGVGSGAGAGGGSGSGPGSGAGGPKSGVVIQQKDIFRDYPDPHKVDAQGNPVMMKVFFKREFFFVPRSKAKGGGREGESKRAERVSDSSKADGVSQTNKV